MVKKQETSSEAKVERAQNPVMRFMRYVEDAKVELRKVTWPTLPETKKTTLAMLGFVVVMAVILGLVDLGLSALIKSILS